MIRNPVSPPSGLLCFSHLRWKFVFQRPQHLLSRAARTMPVVFWEEPVPGDGPADLEQETTPEGVTVVRPRIPSGADPVATERALLDGFLARHPMPQPVLWYYTPRALAFSGHLHGHPTVYDCMDELSAFQGADPTLPALERELMRQAALVFTGGYSLYDAKKAQHPSVHAFPSGVDVAHFRPARGTLPEPENQRGVPHPRAGFYGVLDERFDGPLLDAVAALRPAVQFVILGPVVKIDPASLPQRPNIHYPGPARYDDLPAYLAHWDVALMPFALNEATRFISPTKTPEYLAAGRPVVSTPITDVVRQYGGTKGVQIAGDPAGFAAAIDRALALAPGDWQPEADRLVAGMAWDQTWSRMLALVTEARNTVPADVAAG